MDSRADRTVALMAIQPRFAELILAGAKRVEFRKTRFQSPVSHVVIYSSGPVSKIVGYFEVDGLDVAEPETLWKRYLPIAGVEAKEFASYFGATEQGVAIRIGRVFRLESPVPLQSVSAGAHPPQSFCYLDRSVLESLAAGVSDSAVQQVAAADGRELSLPVRSRSDRKSGVTTRDRS